MLLLCEQDRLAIYVDGGHHYVNHMCFVWSMPFAVLYSGITLFICMQPLPSAPGAAKHPAKVMLRPVYSWIAYTLAMNCTYCHNFTFQNGPWFAYQCTSCCFTVNQHINILSAPRGITDNTCRIYSFTLVSTLNQTTCSFFTVLSSQKLFSQLIAAFSESLSTDAGFGAQIWNKIHS